MSRIPAHTVEDAPEASRALLEGVIQFSPTAKPLNLHAQMAHSPAVLAAYTSIRRATAEHRTLGQQVAAALMLATAGAEGNDYALAITTRLALNTGWPEDKVAALRTGETLGNPKIDALVNVTREAAAHAGHVSDTCWKAAKAAGWSDEHLTEAFAYLGLTLFTAYFLNYAETELDLPTNPPAAQRERSG